MNTTVRFFCTETQTLFCVWKEVVRSRALDVARSQKENTTEPQNRNADPTWHVSATQNERSKYTHWARTPKNWLKSVLMGVSDISKRHLGSETEKESERRMKEYNLEWEEKFGDWLSSCFHAQEERRSTQESKNNELQKWRDALRVRVNGTLHKWPVFSLSQK